MGDNLNGEFGNGTARPVRNEWYAKQGTVYSSEPVHVMDDIVLLLLIICVLKIIPYTQSLFRTGNTVGVKMRRPFRNLSWKIDFYRLFSSAPLSTGEAPYFRISK